MKAFVLFTAFTSLAVAVHGTTFAITNCVHLDVDGTITIDAVKDGQTKFHFKLDLSSGAPFTITGNCTETDTAHSMTVHFNQNGSLVDWVLVFATRGPRTEMDQVIKFTPASLFVNSSLSGEPVMLADIGSTNLSLTNASFLCKKEQSIPFESTKKEGYNFTVTQVIRNLQVQAFNLKGKAFSPAEDCSADKQNQTTPVTEPTTHMTPTEPATTAESSTAGPTTIPGPAENTYVVYNTFRNQTCIVMQGNITFANITYNVTDYRGQAMAGPITIPRMRTRGGNVRVSGTCATEDGSQQMVVTFNQDWNLTLTFAHGSEDATSMLRAGKTEYSLRDVRFEYVLTPEMFPNASDRNARLTAKAQNLTDFLKVSADSVSYKCDSKVSATLDTGVQFQTTGLRYKAFNTDSNISFGDEVSECPADEDSDNVIPIAVGAALGGLIIIMLIAYLICRKKQHQSGYDTL